MDKKEDLIALGKRIREIRIAKRMTQQGLAYAIGKDHPSINKLENGKVNPSYIFLKEVAEGLGVDLKEFFVTE